MSPDDEIMEEDHIQQQQRQGDGRLTCEHCEHAPFATKYKRQDHEERCKENPGNAEQIALKVAYKKERKKEYMQNFRSELKSYIQE